MSSVKQSIKRLSDTKLIIGIGLVITLLQVATFFELYLDQVTQGKQANISELLGWRLLAWAMALAFVFLIVKTTTRFLDAKMPWRKIILIHVLFAFVVSFVWYSLFLFVNHLLCTGEKCDEPFQLIRMVLWYLRNFDKLFLIYLLTASLTYTYHYVQRDIMHRVRHSRMEKQLLEARLMMLKSQLQPHFLFNTLNSIASLIDIDVRRAKAMIADLGGLLRHVLEKKDEQVVSLEDELKLLQQYIDIEKARFAEDLEIGLEVEPGTFQARIPSMLLQPLVENSIQHGFSRDHPQLKVDIRLFQEGRQLVVEVKDDGKGFSEEAGAELFQRGMGLHNTLERLRSLFGEQFTFLVENLHPGVRNRIEIPLSF
ncbi:MAG: histidine kinase [Lewinellaceae bacterium]|nr:histidine kinase [Lewinellaceae bacterium]